MPASPESDEFLLQAVGRGDLAALSRIVERHQLWSWRIAHRFTGNEEDASETLSRTLFSAFWARLDDIFPLLNSAPISIRSFPGFVWTTRKRGDRSLSKPCRTSLLTLPISRTQ